MTDFCPCGAMVPVLLGLCHDCQEKDAAERTYYAAGYAACRETMTPAVLATEDAYLLGHEAGRLAAIRAEVERAVIDPTRGFDIMAKRYQHYADVLVLVPGQAAPYQAEADSFRTMAEDCRRWLQETA